jgi:hypothetical protein
VLEAADGTLGSADDALQVLSENRDRLDTLLRDLEATLANMRVFSEEIRRRPSSLLRGAPPPDRKPGESR